MDSYPQRRVELPQAVVLVDALTSELDGRTELDAVNPAAHQLGLRPRQMLGHARASVESLVVLRLLRSEVESALAHLAEMLLRFGSPVSFRAPDTIWVDITGSSHLYPSEQELALELLGQVRSMGHAARVAIAPGPWLARACAQYLRFDYLRPDSSGILQVLPEQASRYAGELPIISLPIQQDAITWFARLGLLGIDDLRKLPLSSLAGRLEGQVTEGTVSDVLELLQGRDTSVLTPHHPEEAPREEQFWEEPLEAAEPLLFVLKGLAGRLSARLEGRGQAARELLLTIHYDRAIAALSTPEGQTVPHSRSLSFKLATPLFHADDLERAMRLRLQRQELLAPTLGLSLQASAVTEARHSQLELSEAAAWGRGLSTDARSLTVLLAELSADIGAESVGRLTTQESHLLEKSSWLQPISADELAMAANDAAIGNSAVSSSVVSSSVVSSPVISSSVTNSSVVSSSVTNSHIASSPVANSHIASSPVASDSAAFECAPVECAPPACSGADLPWQLAGAAPAAITEPSLPQLPTRVLQPAIEIHAPIRKSELWVIGEQAFVVCDVRFEQRLENVEWWEQDGVSRDYFRVWLMSVSSRRASTPSQPAFLRTKSNPKRNEPELGSAELGNSELCNSKLRNSELCIPKHSGLEGLAYFDRERGKSYLHALFD